jgi:uncharacterized protein YhhL (DUF1145 family)
MEFLASSRNFLRTLHSMLSLLIQNLIESYPGVANAWWVMAIVATVLLALLLLLLWTGGHSEGWSKKWTDPLSVLIFFAFLGWTGILTNLWLDSPAAVLLWALPSSATIAMTPRLLSAFQKKKMRKRGLTPEVLVRSVGEVRQRIPPHQIGRGRVHLSLREAPYDWEAVTGGAPLETGIYVRVVGVIDEHTVLVEPLNPPGHPSTPRDTDSKR